MTKRVLAIVALLVIPSSLAACGGSKGSSGGNSAAYSRCVQQEKATGAGNASGSICKAILNATGGSGGRGQSANSKTQTPVQRLSTAFLWTFHTTEPGGGLACSRLPPFHLGFYKCTGVFHVNKGSCGQFYGSVFNWCDASDGDLIGMVVGLHNLRTNTTNGQEYIAGWRYLCDIGTGSAPSGSCNSTVWPTAGQTP